MEQQVRKLGKDLRQDLEDDGQGGVIDQIAFEVAQDILDQDVKLKEFFEKRGVADIVGAFANYI